LPGTCLGEDNETDEQENIDFWNCRNVFTPGFGMGKGDNCAGRANDC
jgi:hypothetical protein